MLDFNIQYPKEKEHIKIKEATCSSLLGIISISIRKQDIISGIWNLAPSIRISIISFSDFPIPDYLIENVTISTCNAF